jgi:hypothetical protein
MALNERMSKLPAVEPTPEEFTDQMRVESGVARSHLAYVLDHYWQPGWRKKHKGELLPEDHLWRAAQGMREISEAISGKQFGPGRSRSR